MSFVARCEIEKTAQGELYQNTVKQLLDTKCLGQSSKCRNFH